MRAPGRRAERRRACRRVRGVPAARQPVPPGGRKRRARAVGVPAAGLRGARRERADRAARRLTYAGSSGTTRVARNIAGVASSTLRRGSGTSRTRSTARRATPASRGSAKTSSSARRSPPRTTASSAPARAGSARIATAVFAAATQRLAGLVAAAAGEAVRARARPRGGGRGRGGCPPSTRGARGPRRCRRRSRRGARGRRRPSARARRGRTAARGRSPRARRRRASGGNGGSQRTLAPSAPWKVTACAPTTVRATGHGARPSARASAQPLGRKVVGAHAGHDAGGGRSRTRPPPEPPGPSRRSSARACAALARSFAARRSCSASLACAGSPVPPMPLPRRAVELVLAAVLAVGRDRGRIAAGLALGDALERRARRASGGAPAPRGPRRSVGARLGTRPSSASVCGPTTPSTVRPWRRWKRRTAARVRGPYTPSAGRPSARWIAATDAPPVERSRRRPTAASSAGRARRRRPPRSRARRASPRRGRAGPGAAAGARALRRSFEARSDRRHGRGELRSLSIPTEGFLRRLVAYGVSCRARAGRALRRALPAIRPRAAEAAQWVPRSPPLARRGLGWVINSSAAL